MIHKFISTIPDAGDPTQVQPSNWNAEHIASIVSLSVNTLLTTAYDTILASGTIALTLPDATTCKGLGYLFKNVGGGTITINTTAAQTIDGGATASLTTSNQTLAVFSNGTNWDIANTASSSAVSSVFGRTGAITATSGDYSVGQITGAAPLASPALTSVPTAPTASFGTNTTQLATTAFVIANAALPSYYIRPAITAARTVTDAATTNTSNVLTSATANFTAADVGACVIVYSPDGVNDIIGYTGGAQATISSVTNSTTIVMSDTFVATSGGLVAVIGQDASAALNTAFASAIAVAGTLLIPPGQFIINSLNLFPSALNLPVTIQGAGYGQSELVPSPYLHSSVANGPIILLSANVTWTGLDINWLGIKGAPINALTGAIGLRLDGVARIYDSLFTGWKAQVAVGNTVIKCNSDDCMLEGVRTLLNFCIGMTVSSLNFRCSDCEFISTFDAGFQVNDLSWGKTTNCTIQGGTTAANLLGGSASANYYNWFVNCRFSATTTGGINIQSSTTAAANFVGCVFTGGQGGPTGTPGTNISCINNVSPSRITCTNCTFLPTGTGYGVTNLSGGTVVLSACDFTNAASNSWTGKALINAGLVLDGGGNQALLSNLTNTGTITTGSN